MSTTLELQQLVVRLVADATKWNKGFDSAMSKMDKIAQKATQVGKQMTMRVTAPLLVLGGDSVKAFASFEDAMTKSTAIMVGLTDKQRKAMDEQAKALSLQGPQSAKELAEAYYFLASAGLDAEQSMKALPVTQKFATAGAFDMALATDLLTDAQSALGMSVKDAEQNMLNMIRMSDVLVKANTLANASVEQFSIALTSKAGASLKTFNKDVEEGVAVLAALADQGIKAELAGDNLDRVIRLLSKASMDNAEAHKELGFQVFDAQGKMHNMAFIVKQLETILDGMSDAQKVATLDMLGFEATTQQAILPLIGLSDKIADYEAKLRKASGLTNEVSEKQMKSLASQMKLLWNEITLVGIELGQMLIPTMKSLIEYVKEGIKWWKSLSDQTKQSIVWWASVTAAIGPLLIIFGTLASSAMSIVRLFGMLSTVIKVLATSAMAAKMAFVGLVGYLAYKLTTWLTGASAAYKKLNDEIARGNKLSEVTATRAQKNHRHKMMEINALETNAERLAAYRKELAREKVELKGVQNQIKQSDKNIKQFSKGQAWYNGYQWNASQVKSEKANKETKLKAEAAAKQRIEAIEDAIKMAELEEKKTKQLKDKKLKPYESGMITAHTKHDEMIKKLFGDGHTLVDQGVKKKEAAKAGKAMYEGVKKWLGGMANDAQRFTDKQKKMIYGMKEIAKETKVFDRSTTWDAVAAGGAAASDRMIEQQQLHQYNRDNNIVGQGLRAATGFFFGGNKKPNGQLAAKQRFNATPKEKNMLEKLLERIAENTDPENQEVVKVTTADVGQEI